jgi:hypothetical protein
VAETFNALENMGLGPEHSDITLPCHSIPYGLYVRFIGSVTEVEGLRIAQDLR